MNLRQPERRLFFSHIFRQMPLWEVWSEQRPKLTDAEYYNAERDAGVALEREYRTVNHCKPIPRRVRRSMARIRARREWKAAHGSNQ